MDSEYEIRNRDIIRESVAEFCRNPHWAEYLKNAPSELCGRYIALDFCYSETEEEEILPVMERMEKEMTAEDIRYLTDHESGPGKARFAALLKKRNVNKGDGFQ